MNKKIFYLLEENGGYAKNIDIQSGKYGIGIFVLDPSKNIEIFLPNSLLVNPSEIILNKYFELKFKKNVKLNKIVNDFFNEYFIKYGFNRDTKNKIDIFYNEINKLSLPLKKYLNFYFGDLFFKKNFSNKDYIRIYFNSRQIKFDNNKYYMPIIELINHSTEGVKYQFNNGLYIKGSFDNEVFTNYNKDYDTFEFFKNYHFFSPQQNALSCRLEVNFRNKKVMIERNSYQYKKVKNLKIPLSAIIKNNIFVSFIDLISIKKNSFYRKLMIQMFMNYGYDYDDANDFLNNLYNYNINLLNSIKKEAENEKSWFSLEIFKIADNQIYLLNL